MPVIDCDPEAARERVTNAGVEVSAGNTDHERWRAERDGAVAVAYDDKVVVQGGDPQRLAALIREGGGRGHVYFDGASRGNPGPAAIGWAIVTGDGIVAEGGERIADTTNNKAEYEALIRALEAAVDYGLDEADVRGDSQLIVKQIRGEWNVNDPGLREKRVRALELLDRFDRWSIEHVPREINERADELANEAFEG
ncbi:ribonuclease HI [Halobaculum magnesiiphilum]|uniref:Ribonuclease HI family protein n=1 Tax=Halobaculum magnesiiphilum TaxID=1017351 RepID=A0A8T8WA83_9EURY|nr:ribonuclease HI [Halobaculum magnesiiphilum]QZP36745.1 ribonuclease HI family protein [Halobaculum magnesiiphilum]